MRELYGYHRSRFAARFEGNEDGLEGCSTAYQRLLIALLQTQWRTRQYSTR